MSTATATKNKDAILRDVSVKPATPPIIASGIPDDLRSLARWLRWEWRLNPKQTRWTKVPLGEVDEPNTWSAFDRVASLATDGVGITLGQLSDTQWLVGIDLDDCRDMDSGRLTDEAVEIISALDSYTEVSPSGTGVKVFVYTSTPLPQGKRSNEHFEAYDSGRYFCATGQRVPNTPAEVRDATAAVAEFYATYIDPPRNKTELSDRELALSALSALLPARADDRYDWIRAGMALKSVDDDLLEAWDTWSQKSDKYCDGECARLWDGFRRGGLTIGSLIYWATQDCTGWTAPKRESESYPLTDGGNARRFIAEYGQDVRYCLQWGQWLYWDGKRWQVDTRNNRVFKLAKRTIKSIRTEAAKLTDRADRDARWKFADKSDSRERYNSLLALAESEEGVAVEVGELDQHPYLLNCRNGTVDLKTGELREHARGDYLTKILPHDYPGGYEVPQRWMSFLGEIFAGDNERMEFMQRLIGMSLVGSAKEHILPILYGPGANGKSVFIEVWRRMLGDDYAGSAPAELLMVGRNEHPTIIANLFGKRLMAAEETDDGCRLNESVVKRLTGGTALSARGMRQDYWQFDPSHTLVLATNNKPVIQGTDLGIWRRVKLIPFDVTIPPEKQDLKLASKLVAEASAILRWAVAGCLAWQKDGLQAPSSVEVATKEYQSDMDTLSQFLDECCEVGSQHEEAASEVYAAYKRWAEKHGVYVLSSKRLSPQLQGKGYQREKRGGLYFYRGFKVRFGVALPEGR